MLLDGTLATDSLTLGAGWVYDLVTDWPEYWHVDGTLVVQPGVVVRIGQSVGLRGQISAVGTVSQPITFTSMLDRSIGVTAPRGPSPVLDYASGSGCIEGGAFTSTSRNYTLRSLTTCG